jgi:hypothetical protein
MPNIGHQKTADRSHTSAKTPDALPLVGRSGGYAELADWTLLISHGTPN